MALKVFFSFHYKADNWRASQVRNIGAIKGNIPVSDNDWESITSHGESAIEWWINDQLKNRLCTIVLVGAATAGRKWIKYEIKKSWELEKGVVGMCIHNLKDKEANQSVKRKNPFNDVSIDGEKLSAIVKLYDPPYSSSTYVYDHIKENIADYVDEAVNIGINY